MRNYDSEVVHIVYACDDRFAEILGVSLVSLYRNNPDLREIKVYILDAGIKEENRRKLLSICKACQRKSMTFIHAKNIKEKLSMDVAADRGSLSQYARLFVSSDLPKGLGRVLYLDCDVLVRQSIKELWNLGLQGKTIGALMDAFSKNYRRNLGLEDNDVMFNSGVMLIDLDQWKKNKIEEKIRDFVVSGNGKIQQGDQGALNAVLSRDTYCFEPRFNSVTIFYDFTYREMMRYRRPPEFYPKEQVAKAVEEPVLVHFTTSFLSRRPWVKGCTHRYAGEWMKYKEMSPWKQEPLWEDHRPKWKQEGIRIYKMLPDCLAIRAAGLLQAYGRPFLYKMKRKLWETYQYIKDEKKGLRGWISVKSEP